MVSSEYSMKGLKYILKAFFFIAYKIFIKQALARQEHKRKNNRVLVQINSGIGDAIMALPMVHELAARGYEVHAVVNKYTETITGLCPDVRYNYTLDCQTDKLSKTARLIFDLRRIKFRCFIGALPSNLIRDAFLPMILRIPVRAKHVSPHQEVYRNYDFLFNKIMDIDSLKNNTELNLDLVALLEEKSNIGNIIHNIALPAEVIEGVRKKMMDFGYREDKVTAGLHPGCKETWAFKRWPAEKYAELIGKLAINDGLQIILFGGAEERPLADFIVKKSASPAINMVGELSLEETMASVSLCDMFISNDSALMHVATLFKLPVIALFGRTNEVATGPYGKNNAVIKKNDVKDISVKEVYEEVQEISSSSSF